MRIEVFSPEKKGADELERKILESEVISRADIKSYAEDLVRIAQAMGIARKDEAVVITALSHDNIMKLVQAEPEFAELTESEVRGVVDRVRAALMEELKEKLEGDVYLEKRAIKKQKASTELLNDIKVVIPLSGAERIYKNQKTFTEEKDEELLRTAFARFSRLEPHPNISKIVATDQESRKNIAEKLELDTLADYLDGPERGEKELAVSLMAVRDCMRGAEYLEENGFVLQDIHPNNIGLAHAEEGDKGVLFDLEGIIEKGAEMSYGVAHGLKYLYPKQTDPEAMVFQFGLCLQSILEKFKDPTVIEGKGIRAGLEDLVEKMSHPSTSADFWKDPPELSLKEAGTALEAIIHRL